MKKTRLPRVPIVSSLSLLLLIVLIVAWSRSRHHAHIVGFYTPAGNLQALASDRQGVLLFLSDVPFGREMGLSADSMSSSSDEFREIHEWLFDPSNEKWHFLGFRLAKGAIGTWTWKFNAVIVPYWALLIPLAILPLRTFRRLFIYIRRKRRGQCLVCGYDLSHSPERCPECGEPVRIEGKSTLAKSSAPAPKSSRMPIARFLAFSFATALIGSVLALFWRGHQARVFGIWQAEEDAEMHRRIGEFYARGTFDEAIEALRIQTGADIHVKWPADYRRDLDRDTPVDVHLYDTDLGTALRCIISEATGKDVVSNQICPVSGRILVADTTEMPHSVRHYSLRNIPIPAGVPGGGSIPGFIAPLSTSAGSHEAMESFLASMTDSLNNDGIDSSDKAWADVLAVYQTTGGHADVQKFLAIAGEATLSDLPTEPTSAHADLNQPIAELNLENTTTLAEAIETLRREARANILVNWQALLSTGNQLKPVHLHLWNTTVGGALRAVLQSVDVFERLAIVIHDNIIDVTVAGTDLNCQLRVYDIGDLTADAMGFEMTHFKPEALQAGNTLFGRTSRQSSEFAVATITEFLYETVDSESWKNNARKIGNIRAFGGRLYIHQTPENQRKVLRVLNILRSGGGKDGLTIASSSRMNADDHDSRISRCDAAPDSTKPTTDHADLDQAVAELKCDSTLEHAIDSLRDMTHANLVVYWDDIAAAGIKRDTPVKLHLWDTTLGRSLGVLLSVVAGDGSISYVARDGVIVVCSPERRESYTQIPTLNRSRLYDVRDIIDGVIAESRSHPPHSDNGSPASAEAPDSGITAEEAVRSLERIITESVAADTWNDNGGSVGSIREFSGRLLITQTPDAHRRIIELLRAIRAGGGKEGIELGKLPTTQPVLSGQNHTGK